MNLKDVYNTGKEFVIYAFTPIYSSLLAKNELNQHTEALENAQNRLIKLGQEAIQTGGHARYHDIQQISLDITREEIEIWKKNCEVYWVPGMIVYTITSLFSSLFIKQKNQNQLITEYLNKINDNIDEKTLDIKSMIQEEYKKICEEKYKMPSEDFKAFIENNNIKTLYNSYTSMLNKNFNKNPSPQIKKAFNQIYSLISQREGLLKMKADLIDPDIKLTNAKNYLESLKQEYNSMLTKSKILNKKIEDDKKPITKEIIGLRNQIFDEGQKKLIEKYSIDKEFLFAIKDKLESAFLNSINKGNEVNIKDLLNEHFKNISRSESSGLFEQLKNVSEEYYILFKSQHIKNADDSSDLAQYLIDNDLVSGYTEIGDQIKVSDYQITGGPKQELFSRIKNISIEEEESSKLSKDIQQKHTYISKLENNIKEINKNRDDFNQNRLNFAELSKKNEESLKSLTKEISSLKNKLIIIITSYDQVYKKVETKENKPSWKEIEQPEWPNFSKELNSQEFSTNTLEEQLTFINKLVDLLLKDDKIAIRNQQKFYQIKDDCLSISNKLVDYEQEKILLKSQSEMLKKSEDDIREKITSVELDI